MNTLIPDSWLKEYLKTQAKPSQIAKFLSLCGPSVEKVIKENGDFVYNIEVTTNRVDSIGVYGIARELAAILPQFGISAHFVELKINKDAIFSKKVKYLDALVDQDLCPRFAACLIKNVKIKPSSATIQKRIKLVGLRPINNVVDISNYIMHELGQPVHTFDYDKISSHKMILRKSKKGEKITTLDSKMHTLGGGDIVIEDGAGRLIDLAGIMGGQNSAVSDKTKNVLLFVQTYNPVNIRKTFTSLSQTTEAAILFEKGLDPELVRLGTLRGIDLMEELTEGTAEKEVLDLYPEPYKPKTLRITVSFIEKKLGISLKQNQVVKILETLGFGIRVNQDNLYIQVPSFRVRDIEIPEDIVEEVARLYGYHNLPSKLMAGELPDSLSDFTFAFEIKLKRILKELGANEIYTNSLVPKEFVSSNALKLKNPLGSDSEYLRTSLKFSLIQAADDNKGIKIPFHLFEAANVYLPQARQLPKEIMTLSGIFSNHSYREAKGVIEAFLEELNISYKIQVEDAKDFLPNQRVLFNINNTKIGEFGVLEQKKYIYYEFEIEKLKRVYKPYNTFKPMAKVPAQIEDITLILPERTKLESVIQSIKQASKLVSLIELKDIYESSYTFTIHYQHPTKTLTDKEVEEIRRTYVGYLKHKHCASLK